jgi:hypothetical protein
MRRGLQSYRENPHRLVLRSRPAITGLCAMLSLADQLMAVPPAVIDPVVARDLL